MALLLNKSTCKFLVAARTHFFMFFFSFFKWWVSFMYTDGQFAIWKPQCLFFKGGATRSLPWPHHLRWTSLKLNSMGTCWSTEMARLCCLTLNVQSTVKTSCIFLDKKNEHPCIPHLYVSTYENTIQKPLCLASLLLIMSHCCGIMFTFSETV